MATTTLSPPRSSGSEPSPWVVAPPFRALLCQLSSDSGLPWRVLARASGVPAVTVHGLLSGRNGRPVRHLRAIHANQLMRLNLETFTALAHESASCEKLRPLVRALERTGCTPEQIAKFIKLDAAAVRELLGDGVVWCSQLHLLQAEAACEARGLDLQELNSANG